MTHIDVLCCPLLRAAVMDIYFFIEIAVRMSYCAGTLTTEEWKAEQQLFLGEDEEHNPLVAYNQQAVPVSFLLQRCASRQGRAVVGAIYICEQPSVDIHSNSSLAWIATQTISIASAPCEQR